MYQMSEIAFQVSDYTIDLNKLGKQTMLDYDNSFNIFMGTGNSDLDWFDNPYIEPNVYEVTNEWQPRISESIKLRKCDQKMDL